MPDENEQKPSKINWIMLMLIIVCLAVIVFMLIIALGKANNTQPEVPENQPSEANGGKSQIEVEPISDEKSSADNTAINESVESQTDIEKIKMDIITGKTRDVPAGLNLTSRAIIRDYLSDCHMIEDLCKSLGCYELYFLNNDASLKQQKDSCEALSGNERTNCLDQYYFHMGTWERGIFCEAITNPDLMTECVNTAV